MRVVKSDSHSRPTFNSEDVQKYRSEHGVGLIEALNHFKNKVRDYDLVNAKADLCISIDAIKDDDDIQNSLYKLIEYIELCNNITVELEF